MSKVSRRSGGLSAGTGHDARRSQPGASASRYWAAATLATWTKADAAELDVLAHTLAFAYWEHRRCCEACRFESCAQLEAWYAHRDQCAACRGEAPLTFGPPCQRHAAFTEHGATCSRCNPCPHLQVAICEVVDWREARRLRSKAAVLRSVQDGMERAS